MITHKPTERLINGVAIAFLAQVVLTSVHHVYGGLTYDFALRLYMPLLAGIEFLIVLGLLFYYKRTGSGIALTLFSIVATLVGIAQGLFHTLYGHVYKDILFLTGITAERVENFFFPILPNDFVYPPNDLFFEITGVLELVTISLIIVFMVRLIRTRRSE